VFLSAVGVGLSSLVWARPLARLLSPATAALPASLQTVVPGGGWRIYTVAATMPRFDAVSWRLRIDGLVEQPVELDYAALRALPRTEQTSDFHCVTGWSVTGVRWAGVRLRDVLAPARPLPAAKALALFSSEEPYVDSLTLEQAQLPDVLLAYEMDGSPLSRAHGAPARVVIPEMYGYKNVKWVTRIALTPLPVEGYWETRGYDDDAWVGRSNGYGS
jgi:DMSO/TMAO reductase YedYZ molybdopterin-dependent catalytic subunit